MAKTENGNILKTGDGKIVDEWINNVWPENARQAITDLIPNWESVVTLRTAVKQPVIRKMPENCQLVINYNSERNCFVIWNAAIQHYIYRRKCENGKAKLRLSMGSTGERLLHQHITANFQKCYYREFGRGKSKYVELIWILGEEAFVDFCKDYKNMILPDPNNIPKGKTCLYAVAGGEIQYIPSKQ